MQFKEGNVCAVTFKRATIKLLNGKLNDRMRHMTYDAGNTFMLTKVLAVIILCIIFHLRLGLRVLTVMTLECNVSFL